MQLVEICSKIREGFIEQTPFVKDSSDTIYINDESILIKSFDSKKIVSWDDFEYILTILVENRILKVYVAHLVERNSKLVVDLEEKKKHKKRKNKKSSNKLKKKELLADDSD